MILSSQVKNLDGSSQGEVKKMSPYPKRMSKNEISLSFGMVDENIKVIYIFSVNFENFRVLDFLGIFRGKCFFVILMDLRLKTEDIHFDMQCKRPSLLRTHHKGELFPEIRSTGQSRQLLANIRQTSASAKASSQIITQYHW